MRAIIRAICAVVAVGHAGQALPQTIAQQPFWKGSLLGFSGDPGALPAAIARVQAAGGRVLEIRFTSRRGHGGFDAVVDRGGRVEFDHVSSEASGMTLIERASRPDWMLQWQSRSDIALLRSAEIGLRAAVRTAEASNGGLPAVAAGIATRTSHPGVPAPVYNVLLMTPDRNVRRTAVDGRTGLTVANLSDLRSWP